MTKGIRINLKPRDRKYSPPFRRKMESEYFWSIIWPSHSPILPAMLCFYIMFHQNLQVEWNGVHLSESEPGGKKCVWYLKGSEAVAPPLWGLWSVWMVVGRHRVWGILVIFSLLCSPLLWILTRGFLRLQTLRGDSHLLFRSTSVFSYEQLAVIDLQVDGLKVMGWGSPALSLSWAFWTSASSVSPTVLEVLILAIPLSCDTHCDLAPRPERHAAETAPKLSPTLCSHHPHDSALYPESLFCLLTAQ